ncbi:MAG: hypothetical protein ACOCYQ_05705, partial [Alkalispirochaeta sp.]
GPAGYNRPVQPRLCHTKTVRHFSGSRHRLSAAAHPEGNTATVSPPPDGYSRPWQSPQVPPEDPEILE